MCRLPTPIGGVSKFNVALYEYLQSDFSVVRLNTAVGDTCHARGHAYHFKRIVKHASSFFSLLKEKFGNKNFITYHVVNGEWGIVYTIVLAAICRLFSINLVLHHHAHGYIAETRWLMRMLLGISGNHTVYVFESTRMQQAFESRYGKLNYAMPLLNAVFLDVPCGHVRRLKHPLVLGHLSNLCREKGVYDVLALFEEMQLLKRKDKELVVRLKIAGPALTDEVKAKLDEYQQRFPDDIELYGPVYGTDKSEFFNDVDVFCFPTRFRSESEPNVIIEALASGCVVVANARGSIPKMIPAEAGMVSESADEFVADAGAWISSLITGEIDIEEASQAALKRTQIEKEIAGLQLQKLVHTLHDMGLPSQRYRSFDRYDENNECEIAA